MVGRLGVVLRAEKTALRVRQRAQAPEQLGKGEAGGACNYTPGVGIF